MPKRFPRRAVSGEAKPRKARMKSTPAVRYKRAAISEFNISSALFLEHGQHSFGDQEAAEDVDRGQGECEEPKETGSACTAPRIRIYARREKGANHDDRRNRIGHRHSWRVQ